jgi:hypothetical protein
MTQAGLDAAEWELRCYDSAVTPGHWGWAVREEKNLWAVILEVDGVALSLSGED